MKRDEDLTCFHRHLGFETWLHFLCVCDALTLTVACVKDILSLHLLSAAFVHLSPQSSPRLNCLRQCSLAGHMWLRFLGLRPSCHLSQSGSLSLIPGSCFPEKLQHCSSSEIPLVEEHERQESEKVEGVGRTTATKAWGAGRGVVEPSAVPFPC